jgi:hypothetical protein
MTLSLQENIFGFERKARWRCSHEIFGLITTCF